MEFNYDLLPKEMYETYLQRRSAELKRLEQAITEGKVEDFKVVGHQLKGNAPSYGFEDLAEIAKNLEKINAENLKTEGPNLLNEYRNWLAATQSKFHN